MNRRTERAGRGDDPKTVEKVVRSETVDTYALLQISTKRLSPPIKIYTRHALQSTILTIQFPTDSKLRKTQ